MITGYNGMRTDTLTGHQYLGNGYRGYSPSLFRFVSHDNWSPFGAGGLNGYAYCNGDPVDLDDPSGHLSWQNGLGIGLGVLGLLGTAFTAGTSLAVLGYLSVGLAAASGGALVADVSGIMSVATTDHHPGVSGVLGWLSLAMGIITLGAGAGPEIASVAGKLDQALGGWLQGSLSFISKIERRGRHIGIPLSGEFSNALFIGRTQIDERTQWCFRYEDNIPLGRRLNIVTGGRFNGAYTHAQAETMYNNQWVNARLTAARLREYTLFPGEHFSVYRLIFANSGSYVGRGRVSMAGLFSNSLRNDDAIVAGYNGNPVWGGEVADKLQSLFRLTGQLDHYGFGHLWGPNSAQNSLNDLSRQFGDIPGSLTFNGEIITFPYYTRGLHDDANFYQ